MGKFIQIGSLWVGKKDPNCLTGELLGKKVYIGKNKFRKEGSKQPEYSIFLTKEEDVNWSAYQEYKQEESKSKYERHTENRSEQTDIPF